MIIYTTESGHDAIEVRLEDETVWLTQKQMGALFGRDYKTTAKHVKNVFGEGELKQKSTVANFATVQTEGGRTVSRDIEYYNLDVIISVGYRVKSKRGTQFVWRTRPFC